MNNIVARRVSPAFQSVPTDTHLGHQSIDPLVSYSADALWLRSKLFPTSHARATPLHSPRERPFTGMG